MHYLIPFLSELFPGILYFFDWYIFTQNCILHRLSWSINFIFSSTTNVPITFNLTLEIEYCQEFLFWHSIWQKIDKNCGKIVILSLNKIENGNGKCVKEITTRSKSRKQLRLPMGLQYTREHLTPRGVLQLAPKQKYVLVQ